MFRRPRRLMRRTAVQCLEVVEEGGFEFRGEIAQRRFAFADALDDFVVDVRDVHHVLNVEAFELQKAVYEIAKDERAPVADVGEVIDSRAAAIHASLFARRIERNKFLQ